MRPARILNRILTLLALVLAAASAAAQQFALERDSPLYAEPRLDAPQVTQLKQGAWINVRLSAGTGWLFSFNVRFQSAKGETGDTGGPGLGRVLGPRQSVQVTSTIGVRGLEEQDLKQASFNAGQMKLLDGYAVSRQAAEEGARASGLAPEKLDYLRK